MSRRHPRSGDRRATVFRDHERGVTGFLYTDPRRDGGADFERVLAGVESGELRPDRDAAKAYLDAFSLPRFADRLGTIMEDVASAAAAKRTFPV
jgi:hypothetical protein